MSTNLNPCYFVELSKDLGLKLDLPGCNTLSLEQLSIFKENYQAWSKERDRQLEDHLNKSPQLFRCFIPRTERYLTTAKHIIWYYDEIIVDDPILQNFSKPENLIRVLETLYLFREVILAGYLRFAGDSLVPPRPFVPSDSATALANDVTLKAKLDDTVYFGLEKQYNSINIPFYLYIISLDYVYNFGWKNAEPFDGTLTSVVTPPIRIGDRLKECTAQELAKALEVDPLLSFRDRYPLEVNVTIHNVCVASILKATPFFDREIDELILQKLVNPDFKQLRDIGSLKLALPYLEGVKPENLQELREKIPDAFRDFRNKMATLANKTVQEDPENFLERGRLFVESDLLPQIRALNSETKAITEKKNCVCTGARILAASACFGACLGLDIPIWPTLLGAVASDIAVQAEYRQKTTSLECNPFYFIWRAKK